MFPLGSNGNFTGTAQLVVVHNAMNEPASRQFRKIDSTIITLFLCSSLPSQDEIGHIGISVTVNLAKRLIHLTIHVQATRMVSTVNTPFTLSSFKGLRLQESPANYLKRRTSKNILTVMDDGDGKSEVTGI